MELRKLGRLRAFICYMTGPVTVLLLTFSSPAFADILLGQVVHVTDGDGFTMVDAGKRELQVRLSGIDAPEPGQVVQRSFRSALGSACGRQAYSSRLLPKGSSRPSCRQVFFNCMDINLAQIQKGLAWHDTEHTFEQSPADMRLYATAEIKARKAARGLWQEPNPVAPWDWRHHGRTLTSSP
jgi:endonuclease YncB( thermonuclease family)